MGKFVGDDGCWFGAVVVFFEEGEPDVWVVFLDNGHEALKGVLFDIGEDVFIGCLEEGDE